MRQPSTGGLRAHACKPKTQGLSNAPQKKDLVRFRTTRYTSLVLFGIVIVVYWIKLTLIGGLLLAGFPHAFCCCGKARAVQPRTVSVCPHCVSPAEKSPEKPKPCTCRPCRKVDTVAADPPVTVPSPSVTDEVVSSPVLLVGRLVAVAPLEIAHGTGPPGPAAGHSCPLPIFLGHLLF